MPEVMIGVQARSTSTRLPGKSLEMIDKKTMTEHVLSACQSTVNHINRNTHKHNVSAFLVLLVPEGDILAENFDGVCSIVEGPEDDVLKRFMMGVEKYHPDYICRVTADCPLMSPPIITKHIMCATKDHIDYCSNVWYRSYIDGWDVEVMSRTMMQWVDENAIKPYDREHVTTLIREKKPAWARYGSVISHIDFSDIKLSVDNMEELERVRKNRADIYRKVEDAHRAGQNVYRF